MARPGAAAQDDGGGDQDRPGAAAQDMDAIDAIEPGAGQGTGYLDPNLPDLASSLLWAHRKGSSGGEAADRIRTNEDQAAFYRAAREEWRRRRLPKNLLFALCLNFWLQWLSEVRASYTKWDPIHRRDRWKCANPMCDRQVCTLHHVVFQALGGDDRWENLITLCEKCHLDGVHERQSLRLFARGAGRAHFRDGAVGGARPGQAPRGVSQMMSAGVAAEAGGVEPLRY